MFDKKEEKIFHLKGLIAVTVADGVIHKNEIEHLKRIMKLYQIDQTEFDINNEITVCKNNPNYLKECINKIKERKKKLYFIQDLISLAFVDDDFSQSEEKTILNIGNLLNIENTKINDLCNLNKKYVEINKNILSILNS